MSKRDDDTLKRLHGVLRDKRTGKTFFKSLIREHSNQQRLQHFSKIHITHDKLQSVGRVVTALTAWVTKISTV